MFNKDTCTSAGSGSYRGTAADRHGLSLSALSVGGWVCVVVVVVGRCSAVLILHKALEGGRGPSGGRWW